MKKRAKILLLGILLIFISGSLYFYFGGNTPEDLNFKPEIINTGEYQATIAWNSKTAYKGIVYFQSAGSNSEPESVEETISAGKKHEITITGLESSTRYSYWLKGSEKRYQFQTQPSPSTPFTFLLTYGDISDRITSLYLSEMPEFIFSLSKQNKNKDYFESVRPYISVYDLQGVDSIYLNSAEEREDRPLRLLDWGGMRLFIINDISRVSALPVNRQMHTSGVITSLKTPPLETDNNKDPHSRKRAMNQKEISNQGVQQEIKPVHGIKDSPLHLLLTGYNRTNPDNKIFFAGIIGMETENLKLDGIQYFGIDISESGSVRCDIDIESSTAFFNESGKTVSLKDPPLQNEKRTCKECRRLADRGSYEAGIKAYKEFINTNSGHFQIDDAYYAIADIYDEKLFKFDMALEWYKKLKTEYPASSLIPLAEQRIKYLDKNSDNDFLPLSQFERIRKIEFARKSTIPDEREKLLMRVKSLIIKYPGSKLAPVMQYWLANQYRETDPDEAVAQYEGLLKNYPGYSSDNNISMDIGTTYYDTKQYKKAIAAYRKALPLIPEFKETIQAQISNSERNIRRTFFSYISIGVIIVLLSVCVCYKPAGLKIDAVIPLIFLFLLLAILFQGAGFLIYEQFTSMKEMSMFVISISIIASLSSFFSLSLVHKLIIKKKKRVLFSIIGSVTGILLFTAGLYLAVYYINTHYLIIAGL